MESKDQAQEHPSLEPTAPADSVEFASDASAAADKGLFDHHSCGPIEMKRSQREQPPVQRGNGYANSLISSGVTLAVCLLPKLVQKARKHRAGRRVAGKACATPEQGTATPVPESPVLRPFGSPCATHAPATPTVHRKPQEKDQAESADNDSDTAPSRSTDQGLQQSPSTKQESAEALKQQLKLLMQMQEENKKLRAFMEQHLSSSQKAVTLEAENQALKAAKQALEAELEALRRPAFELNNGEELEKFKRALPNSGGALVAPTHAHSMCSDAHGLGGTPSVDGAPSMAATDLPAGRAKQQSGVVSDFVKWVRNGSSAATGPGSRQGAAPPRPPAPSASRAESLRSERAPPSTAKQGGGMKPSDSNADVTQLLEAWSSGAGAHQMVL